MHNILTQYSSALPEKHRGLAATFGIPSPQILTVQSNFELRRVARLLGDEVEHSDGVMGLCLRAESQDEFTDPQIVLVWPLAPEVHETTYKRLKRQGFSPIENYRDISKTDWLLAFVLLHEIAHYKLNHGREGDHEDEADFWAHYELVKHTPKFSCPQHASTCH